MHFHEWLRRTGRSHSTAGHYVGAIYGRLTAMTDGRLSDDMTLADYDALVADLTGRDDFVELNRRGNRMYANALRRYREFLVASEATVPVEVADIAEIERDAAIPATERLSLVRARLGQGLYRRQLIERWGRRCSVTGYADPRLLIASHIKPWYEATNAERLDPANGLLLTPNLDKVFDLGLITFDARSDGRIVFAKTLADPVRFGLREDMRLRTLGDGTAVYLEHHRRNVFLG